VGLITGLLTLPLAPVRGTIWIAERLLEEAERELNDPKNIEEQLLEAEASYERGELSEDEYERLEDELVRRLTARGDW
jgi:NAD-specific glutamate dehydrogenase